MMSDRLSIKTNPILTAKHLASLHSAGVYTGSDLVLADLNSLANRCTLSINELSVLKRCVVEAVADPVTGECMLGEIVTKKKKNVRMRQSYDRMYTYFVIYW